MGGGLAAAERMSGESAGGSLPLARRLALLSGVSEGWDRDGRRLRGPLCAWAAVPGRGSGRSLRRRSLFRPRRSDKRDFGLAPNCNNMEALVFTERRRSSMC